MPFAYELYRQDHTLLKAAGGGDVRQVPAAGTIDIYYRGARVSAPSTGQTNHVIAVFDPGTIRVGDTLQYETNAAVVGTVDAVTATTIQVDWTSPVTVATGGRLIIQGRRPLAYSDPQGTTSLGSTVATDAQTGYTTFYTRPRDLDLIATVDAQKRVMADQSGQGAVPLDPFDFGLMADGTTDDQAALDAVLDYVTLKGLQRVVLPPGDIRVGSSIVAVAGALALEGSGRGVTTITAVGANVVPIVVAVSDFTLRNLTLSRTVSGGAGISLLSIGPVSRTTLSTLHFKKGAIGVLDTGIDTLFDDVIFSGDGWERFVSTSSATRPHLRDIRGRFANDLPAGDAAIYVGTQTTGPRLTNVDVGPSDLAQYTGRGLVVAGATPPTDVTVLGGHFSGGDAAGAQPACELTDGRGVVFVGTTFDDSDRGVFVNGSSAAALRGVTFTGCTVVGVRQEGYRIAGGSFIAIEGGVTSEVNEADNFHDHVYIVGTLDDITVRGLRMGNIVRGGAAPANKGVGVRIAAGTGDRIVAFGNLGRSGDITAVVANEKLILDVENVYVDHNVTLGSTPATEAHIASPGYFKNYTTGATPNVGGIGFLELAYPLAEDVTDFVNGALGQLLVVRSTNANVTLKYLAAGGGINGIKTLTGADRVLAANQCSIFVRGRASGGGQWAEVLSY